MSTLLYAYSSPYNRMSLLQLSWVLLNTQYSFSVLHALSPRDIILPHFDDDILDAFRLCLRPYREKSQVQKKEGIDNTSVMHINNRSIIPKGYQTF